MTIQADPDVLKNLGLGKHRKKHRWLKWLIMIAALGAVVAVFFVWRARKAQNKGEQWVTAPVELVDLRETVTATGTLSALDSVEVGAEVTGRVIKVHVDLNDQVKEGQVLVEIDTEQLRARVEESQAQLRSAQASHTNAKANVKEAEAKAKRTRELHQRGLASDADLEAAEAALERAKASVSTAAAQITVANAGLKSANTSVGKAIIKSPIDGVVLARSVEAGQTVTAGFQTPILFTLAKDLTRMQLKVDVDEADIGKVNDGQRATFVVDAYPKRQFPSKVVRLSYLPKAGTTVVTYEAELAVDNADRLLRPGMTATATIITSEQPQVLSVPNAALRFRPSSPSDSAAARPRGGLPVPGLGGPRFGGSGRARPADSAEGNGARSGRGAVWVVRDSQLARVPVEVGATDGRRTEVKSEEINVGVAVVVDVADGAE